MNWAVIGGEAKTGVTTLFLDHKIDTGRMILQGTFEIKDDYNVEDVYNGLMSLGAKAALKTLDMIIAGNGNVETMEQDCLISDESVLHSAPKIFKETCQINWNNTCKQIYDFIRGLSPYPGAWTNIRYNDGKSSVLKIYNTSKTTTSSLDITPGTLFIDKGQLFVATKDCWLRLNEIQLSGKKRMDAKTFINGFRGEAVLFGE